ncbi:hypothetical protein DFH08DRAFT_975928 [Mycena albidolilacea]|uniref:Uncharacterized protein n=1 Tax=Mycena albidolilacea TaxID=1033008 RepID=A0AAD6Z493_9AGAR|nr:hypothetical protein DFH08DRAFT_975928 [Mycena albidolilacea]
MAQVAYEPLLILSQITSTCGVLYNAVAVVLEVPHTAAPPLSPLPALSAYFADAVCRTLSAPTSLLPLPPSASVPAVCRSAGRPAPPAHLRRHRHARPSPIPLDTALA